MECALLLCCSVENCQIIEFRESLREQEFDVSDILSHTRVPYFELGIHTPKLEKTIL